ncbi:MAG TPA: TIR domain-containing protein [Sphingomonas sp.]|uniref:TIR domain-containing protein n=1 Tax=Sphingomonas sp. TaxID=28214 RepID=UPI002BE342CA|nr:TIR domain-containing protein [Sphingomonas sp.]HMI18146.1 TIR domain-containing protein [Sphingomonas sp.]
MTGEAASADKRRCVFLSYARGDRKRVEPIAQALRDAGIDLWWDALIEGGEAFARKIEERLAIADAVVAIWSRASVESDWVRDEAGQGRDSHKLVPISLDGTEPPLGFRQYHAIDLSAWRGDAAAPEFVALLRAIAAPGERTTSSASDRRPKSGASRRWILAFGGVSLAAVLATGGIIWRTGLLGRSRATANSVAVIPFETLGDASQAYFSEGLAEEIRATLARDDALQVAAPTSSNKFRGLSEDARIIAEKLGVAFLLEGSVQRAADMVRVTAELIDATTGLSRWSQTFDRKLSDVFAVQSEIASTVADDLASRVGTRPKTSGGTDNVAAYEAFLHGRTLFSADKDESTDRGALAQYDAAVTLDPDYAAAFAARSRVKAAIASTYAKPDELRTLYDAAIADAQRAVAIAPDLPQAQLALAYALYTGRLDVEGARAPYDRAYALGGGDADTAVSYAFYCSRTGRSARAIEAVERATRLDRLNPRAFRAAASVQIAARHYEAAVQAAEEGLRLDPTLGYANGYKGVALFLLGRLAEARAAFLTEPRDMGKLPGLAIVERKLGNAAAAEAAMRTLVDTLGDSAIYQQAEVLAQWGQIDRAFAALQRAETVGDAGLMWSATDPLLDPLRTDPRFQPLLRRLHLA